MPAEADEEEVIETFAARQHTLDRLVKGIRDQSTSGTCNSYFITGPRGAGKSTLLLMLQIEFREDADWYPILFPEEMPAVTSLRDLLVSALEQLAQDGIENAETDFRAAENELDEDRSQSIAEEALLRISRSIRKRFLLLIENFDSFIHRATNDQSQAVLRRMLMEEPCLMIVGTAVKAFAQLERYEEPLFSFFSPVPLEQLNEDQVEDLIRQRAEFEGNEQIIARFEKSRSRIRALTRITGGNPRLILMIYEVLCDGPVIDVVNTLRQLISDLTPLLKDVVENQLSPPQAKIIDSIMKLGGKATPTDIAKVARMPDNNVRSQIKRLVDSKVLTLSGGGKGKPAYYEPADQLFATWYQIRYLRAQRRRIELFVQVLKVWFEEDERLNELRRLTQEVFAEADSHHQRLQRVAEAEYFLAAMPDSALRALGAEEVSRSYEQLGRLTDAAAINSEFQLVFEEHDLERFGKDNCLAEDLIDEGKLNEALEILNRLLGRSPGSPSVHARALLLRGIAKGSKGDNEGAIEDCNALINLEEAPIEQIANAFNNRGVAKGSKGDNEEAIEDYSALIKLEGVPIEQISLALFNRGVTKGMQGNSEGAIEDYNALIKLESAPIEQIAWAIFNRSLMKSRIGNSKGAIDDCNALIKLEGAPLEQIARALCNRGIFKGRQGDNEGAIEDCNALIKLDGASTEQIAMALNTRGFAKRNQGNNEGGIEDYSAVINLKGAPIDQIALALNNRGYAKSRQGNNEGAIEDYNALIKLEGAPFEQIAKALFNRGIAKGNQGDNNQAIEDFVSCLERSWPSKDLFLDVVIKILLWRSTSAIRILFSETICPLLLNDSTNQKLPENWKEGGLPLPARLLSQAASVSNRETWLVVWDSIVAFEELKSLESLSFYRAVAEALRTKSMKVMDSLPKHEREFAEEVLAKIRKNSDDSEES